MTGSLIILTDWNGGDGEVQVYERDLGANTYSPKGLPIWTGGGAHRVGCTLNSIAITSDGTHVIIGAPNIQPNQEAKVFKWDGSEWVQKGNTITESGSSGLGGDLAISDDGLLVVVGLPYLHNYRGEIRLYEYINNIWTIKKIIEGVDGPGNTSSISLGRCSISGSGNRILACDIQWSATTSTDQTGYLWVYSKTGYKKP